MVALLMALGIGYLICFNQIDSVTSSKPSEAQINLMPVRTDLLSLARAERLYLASNGRFATLEELRDSNLLNSFPDGNRSGYLYDIEMDGAEHFRITASPSDSSRAELPTLSIDENLLISP